MKPIVGFTKESVLPETICIEKEKGSLGRGWKAALVTTAVVLGLSFLATVVVLTLHLHKAAPRDVIKEYLVTVDNVDTQTSEVLRMSDREEIFITEDGNTAVFDFATGLVTFSLDEQPDSCYLTSFNTLDFQTPDDFKAQHTGTEVYLMARDYLTRSFHFTDISVNKKVLGPMAEAECSDRNLYILEESTDVKEKSKSRRKRKLKWKVTVNLGIVKFEFGNKD